MLATLKDILKTAEKENFAIGAFNTPNFECVQAVLENAEELNKPVIIAHAELHEDVSHLSDIGPVMIDAAKRANVDVCVHLDHGEHLEYLEKALKLGFTSIMYDGSLLVYDINRDNTCRARELADKYNASLEAEIGVLGGREGTKDVENDLYTDPQLAKRFVDDTNVDALACSFGTAHGIYKEKPKLDFARIEQIKKLCDVPLVMHGGSGVSPEDYKTCISMGVRKINYYSYMSNAGLNAARDILKEDITFFHDIALAAKQAMKKDSLAAMKVFYGLA